MKLIIASLSLLSFMACVEPAEDALDPIERTAPGVSVPDQPSDEVAEHAPQCGDGTVTYYDWACLNDGNGWTLVAVGFREWVCDAAPGQPYGGPLIGRTTSCKGSDQSECSTSLPSSTCNYQPYGAAHCPLPKPTTYCYTRGVLPPLPPVFPPGGGSNG